MSWPTPVADVQVSALNHRDRGGCHLFDSLRHTSWRQIILARGAFVVSTCAQPHVGDLKWENEDTRQSSRRDKCAQVIDDR